MGELGFGNFRRENSKKTRVDFVLVRFLSFFFILCDFTARARAIRWTMRRAMTEVFIVSLGGFLVGFGLAVIDGAIDGGSRPARRKTRILYLCRRQ